MRTANPKVPTPRLQPESRRMQRNSRRMTVLVLTGVLSLLLNACSTLSAGTRMNELAPESWQSTHNVIQADAVYADDLSQWWMRFNDPTLTELVELALAEGPTVESARLRLVQARAARTSTNSGFWPSLSASAGSNVSRNENLDTDEVGIDRGSSTGLGASWQLDLFGEQRATSRAANADLDASEAALYGARVTLASQVAAAWFEYRTLHERYAVTQNSLAFSEESYELNCIRVQVGLDSGLELLQQTATIESTRSQLPALKQSLQESANAISLLCGRTPGELIEILEAGVSQNPNTLPVVTPGIPAETLRQRPDVIQAEAEVEAAIARRQAAQRSRFPSLSLSGNVGASSGDLDGWFTPEQLAMSAAAGLTAPLFQAGKLAANVKSQQAAEEQAWLSWRTTVQEAIAEVQNAIGDLEAKRVTREAIEHSTEATMNAADLVVLQEEAGLADRLSVLDAQRNALSAQQSLTAARAAEWAAQASLYAALGGGWDSGNGKEK